MSKEKWEPKTGERVGFEVPWSGFRHGTGTEERNAKEFMDSPQEIKSGIGRINAIKNGLFQIRTTEDAWVVATRRQLRRLVKKARKEYWIRPSKNHSTPCICDVGIRADRCSDANPCIRVRELKP